MDTHLKELLQKHWGFDDLRNEQREVIEAILKGRDVLAVLPTGAGKSICFQLPALCLEGVTLVVSPLVALMQEQASRLQKIGVSAVALDASLPSSEIRWILSEAHRGRVRLLYSSPERLQQPNFRAEIAALPVRLLVVDEAHCISSWGHDFRPSYLRVSELRSIWKEQLPLLALTATAPLRVREEIISVLDLQAPLEVLGSLRRSNLSYSVFSTQKKSEKLRSIIEAVPGTALIYAPTRKSCKWWASNLQKAGQSAQSYHAGLSSEQRRRLIDQWSQGKIRALVATSALSMGVDHADLSLVVHLYLPESLASYYQEVGRAGRRGQRSYAVLLYNKQDEQQADTLHRLRLPNEPFTRRVYQALGNYYKIAVGSGAYFRASFDLTVFSKTYRLEPKATYYALQQLVREGHLHLSEIGVYYAKLRILAEKTELYEEEIQRPLLSQLLRELLRRNGGRIYVELVKVDEPHLARLLHTTRKAIREELTRAQHRGLLQYIAPIEGAHVTLLSPRYEASELPLDRSSINTQKEALTADAAAVTSYIRSEANCREQHILLYFGEETQPCQRCDLCQAAKHRSR